MLHYLLTECFLVFFFGKVVGKILLYNTGVDFIDGYNDVRQQKFFRFKIYFWAVMESVNPERFDAVVEIERIVDQNASFVELTGKEGRFLSCKQT